MSGKRRMVTNKCVKGKRGNMWDKRAADTAVAMLRVCDVCVCDRWIAWCVARRGQERTRIAKRMIR